MIPRRGAAIAACVAGVLTVVPAFAQAPVTAFVNVSVIPMDSERVLPGQTVVVQGHRIMALGPVNRVSVPAGARRLDGRGKFLLPGLADMHVHIRDGNPKVNEASLMLFVANGVTTVRDMHSGGRDGRRFGDASRGQRVPFDLRRRVASGALIGPRIYTAGDPDQRSAAEAARSVIELDADGHDFIKIGGEQRSGQQYDSIIAAARRARVGVVGHVPATRRLDAVLRDRWASIEHLTGYYNYLLGGYDPEGFLGQAASAARLGDTADWMRPAYRLDPARLRGIANLTKQAGVWNCPTLKQRHYFDPNTPAVNAVRRPATASMTPKKEKPTYDSSVTESLRPLLQLARRVGEVSDWIVKALQDAGAGLLLGTDVGDETFPDVPPGFGVVTELQLLVKAGLTPYQALATGTRNAAVFVGTFDSTGTVAVGKRADLVLLNGNPLQDIGRVAGPAGVMVGGRWLSRADIDGRLDRLATWKDFNLRDVRRVMWGVAKR